MQNCAMAVKGDVLTITVNLAESQGTSKTGKSEIIATTAGNISIPGKPELKLGLNLYRPRAQ
jgi:hypothetical protein